jgi:hypothetical protein
MPFSRDLAHRVAGSLAMAGIGCWAAWEGRTLGLFVLGTPAPGLFPFIFGCMLLVMALLCLIIDIAAMRGGGADPAVPVDDRSGLTRVAGYLAVGVGCAIAMQWVGFVLAAFVALLLLMRGFERMPWKVSLLTTVGATSVAYVLFVRLLGVPLPAMPL